MPANKYLPVAAAAGSNVQDDATWAGSGPQVSGFVKGTALSAAFNKALRQATVPASALGQIIVDHALVDASDDGNVLGLKANLRTAMAAMLAGAAFAVDQSATANVVQAAIDPVPPSLSTFRGVFVRVANTNTGPVTFALNNLGTKALVKKNGAPLVAGDLVAGQISHFIYDLTLGQWVLGGSAPSDTVTSIAASKALFNVRQFQTSTRVSMTSPGAANSPIVSWSGFFYQKQSATSLVIAWLTFTSRSPYAPGGSNASASQFILTVSGNPVLFTITNAYPTVAYQNNAVQTIGIGNPLPKGALAVSLSFQRPDSSPWTCVFCPNMSDESHFGASTPATIVFAEVEP